MRKNNTVIPRQKKATFEQLLAQGSYVFIERPSTYNSHETTSQQRLLKTPVLSTGTVSSYSYQTQYLPHHARRSPKCRQHISDDQRYIPSSAMERNGECNNNKGNDRLNNQEQIALILTVSCKNIADRNIRRLDTPARNSLCCTMSCNYQTG